jgi:hypothetical protein
LLFVFRDRFINRLKRVRVKIGVKKLCNWFYNWFGSATGSEMGYETGYEMG